MITQTYHHFHCMELTEAIKIEAVIIIWPNINSRFLIFISEIDDINIMFYPFCTSCYCILL